MIDRIGVVIPARDEELLIGGCLDSVLQARAQVLAARAPDAPLEVDIVVVLDACRDGTAAAAGRFAEVTAMEGPGLNVGAARAAGVDAVIGRAAHPERLWIANTDADSRVPVNWLSHQLELAEAGADFVLGTVRPILDELPEAVAQRWRLTHEKGRALGNIHGANLGFRAVAYRAAGGYRALMEHEDVALVDDLERCGATRAVSDAAEVETSARTIGRTPGGYAAYLARAIVAVEPVA